MVPEPSLLLQEELDLFRNGQLLARCQPPCACVKERERALASEQLYEMYRLSGLSSCVWVSMITCTWIEREYDHVYVDRKRDSVDE